MKVELVTYEYDALPSIQFVPETQWEEKLLESLWRYGTLESGRNYKGFCLRFAPKENAADGESVQDQVEAALPVGRQDRQEAAVARSGDTSGVCPGCPPSGTGGGGIGRTE